MVEKGEIAHFEQFQLFPQCFLKTFFLKVLVPSSGHICSLILMKHGQTLCLDKIPDKFENRSCWVKN